MKVTENRRRDGNKSEWGKLQLAVSGSKFMLSYNLFFILKYLLEFLGKIYANMPTCVYRRETGETKQLCRYERKVFTEP